mmetsp:Transcript_3329/g.3502  ORF Transcript_3329/g.3502 Transcript_3329/m.3502 type:complete len:388 (+) Transcript_3329:237-1400(+)
MTKRNKCIMHSEPKIPIEFVNMSLNDDNEDENDYYEESSECPEQIIASPSLPTSILDTLLKRSDTINFATVYAQQEVSELLSLSIEHHGDLILVEDAINSIPLLMEGSKQWLGYINISDGVIAKFLKVLRRQRQTKTCTKALEIIIALCADTMVSDGQRSYGHRFSCLSTIKIITLLLDQHLVTNIRLKKKQSILLHLVAKKWQKMNIDDNVKNTIFSYLYSEKANNLVIKLCCQLILTLVNYHGIVNEKKLSSSGCCEAVVSILKTTDMLDITYLALSITKELVKRYKFEEEIISVNLGCKLIKADIFETMIPVLVKYINDLSMVQVVLSVVFYLLERPNILGSISRLLALNAYEIIEECLIIHKDNDKAIVTGHSIMSLIRPTYS